MTESLLAVARDQLARLRWHFHGCDFLQGHRLLAARLRYGNLCCECERELQPGDVAYCVAGRSWRVRWCETCAAKLNVERVELAR